MYKLQDIALHREEKLKTLLSDQVEIVVADFRQQLLSIPQLKSQTILDSLNFALKQKYGGSKLNKYYVTHPIRVARMLLNWMNEQNKFSTEAIQAALIHNVIEKEILSEAEIETEYGKWTSHTIKTLTQNREAMKESSHHFDYYQQIYNLDSYGQLIKFFDKFDNLYAICLNPSTEIRERYIDEIEQKVRPIAVMFYPEILEYFDALIKEMRMFGSYTY